MIRRRYFFLLVILAWLPLSVNAGDKITFSETRGGPPLYDLKGGRCIPSTRIVGVIEGNDFEQIRPQIRKVIKYMGQNHTWHYVMPDSSYLSAEIIYGGETYIIETVSPLYLNNETTALSETQGIVTVSGKAEKEKIEAQNSNKYRAMENIFRYMPR